MSTLVLSFAGRAIGTAIGGPIGGFIGGALGTLAGSAIDASLFGQSQTQNQEGPRLKEMEVMGSTEGSPIQKVFGRSRLGSQVIYADDFKEHKETEEQGGKGGGGGAEVTTYSYSISFAVAFCEGNARTHLGRVWADGKVMDLSKVTYRFYPGSATQAPDPLMEEKLGVGNAPAMRGVCYMVFEDLYIEQFGNHIPQITAEIIKPLDDLGPNDLELIVKGVDLIPSSGEQIYATTPVWREEDGESTYLNQHTPTANTDMVESIKQMDSLLYEADTVALVVAWYGTDLRAGMCEILPKVEFNSAGGEEPDDMRWEVAGLDRTQVPEVSLVGGNPAFGGTPSDKSVIECIQHLKGLGKRVIFYPFVMMDVPQGNALPSPYGGASQPAYPWRGRITCHPAAGQSGTVDKTAAAGTQVSTFFTRANGYNRFINHYIALCQEAGGVDGFLVGSELIGLTTVRSAAATFPAVSALMTLAATAKSTLGSGCKVSYGADWSEYHSYRPTDGTGDVYFHLDPLWASPNVDFVGIDNYLPLSDWRDGGGIDYDAVNGPTRLHNIDYLKSNVEGGEYFDWFYASQADRDAQVRTPITDGAGKPWVFRNKDIRSWWSSSHVNRPGGTESGGNTAWVAQSKPVWFTEFGCPAVTMGTNQPNVFYDPKSSESFLPHYSDGRRDDMIQRLYIEATLQYWRDNSPTAPGGFKMIDIDNCLVWTWDARPYPEFPYRDDIWSDADNWNLGHWLTGRVGMVPLARLVREIALMSGLPDAKIDVSGLYDSTAVVTGYVVADVTSPRDMIGPLQQVFCFDSYESEGKLHFQLRSGTVYSALDEDELVSSPEDNGGFSVTRAQETELPQNVKLSFIDKDNEYQTAGVNSRKQVGSSLNTLSTSVPIVMSQIYAKGICEVLLQEAWQGREVMEFKLPPSLLWLDPADGLLLTFSGRTAALKIEGIETALARTVNAKQHDTATYEGLDVGSGTRKILQQVQRYGRSKAYFLDIPLLTGEEPSPMSPRLVAYQAPFPSSVALYRLQSGQYGYTTAVDQPAVVGRLTAPLYSGPRNIFDMGSSVYVQLLNHDDQLLSRTEFDVFAGANIAAVQNADGGWELLQFVEAELIGSGQYRLSRLLRGQQSTGEEMRNPVAAGAPVVFITSTQAMDYLPMGENLLGSAQTLRFGPNGNPTSGDTFQDQTLTFQGVALKPWAPVFLSGAASGNDRVLSWVRCTRFNGDAWEGREVPLNEEREEYDVEVMNGSTVVRSATVSAPTWTYSEADQVADFGSVVSSVTFRVYQVSAVVDRGRKAEATVYF